jgi:cell division protein FtsA
VRKDGKNGVKKRKEDNHEMKQRMVAAVDVGSSKICSLLANVDAEGSTQIVGIGITPSAGINKGMVIDIDQAAEAIRQSVRKAEQTSGESITSVYLGISTSNIDSQGNRASVSVGRNARTVRRGDVERAMTVAREINISEERKLLHVIPTQYTLDTQIGLHAFRMDLDTHIVTIPESAAENITKCARKAGLSIDGLILQCLASARAVLHPDETDAGVVMADIGAGTTGISAYKNGNLLLTAVLPVGGNQITRDLSVGLGIPFEMAEQLKKEHCNLAPKEDADEEDPTVKVNYDGVGKIYKKDINDIVRARSEEMIKLIVSQIAQMQARNQSYLNYVSEFPAGLVLTGGTANLGGIRFLAQELTDLPTRIGVPTGMSGLADRLHNASFASSIGILLFSSKSWRHEQNWVRGETLKDKVLDRVYSVKQRIPWGRS